MSGLTLRLLGAPEVTQDGKAVSGFRSNKARALLFYVAINGEPQSRARLAGLLWGELPEENATANLRKTLTNLRKVAGPHLSITREAVGVDEANRPWLDVRTFEAALDRGELAHLQTAVDLYRGDFLQGFYVPEAPEFETWLLRERYRLRERLLAGLKRASELEAARGDFHRAIIHAQRLLALEPLREDAHRLLMTLFARNGQRARALAQYEACAQILSEELEVEPGAQTTALFRQIRDGVYRLRPAAIPRHNLPAPTTSFVGREEELAAIREWLANAPARLLTILGPGGVGKTRLAHESAWRAIDHFADGVWVVSLATLETPAGLAARIAATLGVTFFGKEAPEAQVTRYLRRKALLLVLDNAEHILSQAFADLLLAILRRAPAVKIVVTSRERLAMQAEQVLELPGLTYPAEEAGVPASAYAAGRLFLQRVEGHGHALAAGADVDEAIRQLCRLVDGLPLALELAASWTPAMSLENIVAAVERAPDFLETRMRDVPLRQRTMRAVFDTSWELLGIDEQRILRQLAYFRGGFAQNSASAIARASAEQLQSLVEKSLIRADAGGRYDMHELVRHFAAEKLAQHPDEADVVARRHARYFAAFLAEREEAIQGTEYLQARAGIDAELENVRKAWDWALTARSPQDIARSSEALHHYFLNTQGSFAEAAERFERAAISLSPQAGEGETGPLVGQLLLKAAANRRMLGQLDEANRLAEESLALFYRHELAAGIMRATSTLSVIRLQQNEKKRALRLAREALELARELDNPVDLCLALNNLAYVLAHNEKREAAIRAAEESVALAQRIGYPHGLLSALNMLGVYYQQDGNVEKAQAIFERLVDRCRETGTRSRLAQAVNNLGTLYKKQGELERALPLLREAMQLYEAVGQAHYAAFARVTLGQISLEQGDPGAAWLQYRQVSQTAQEIEMPALALNALALYAQLLIADGLREEAVAVLSLVANHPAAMVDAKGEARHTLDALRKNMTVRAFATARDQGLTLTLEEALQKG